MQQDFIQRFLFDSFPARGALARLQDTWEEVLTTANYPPCVRQLLGEALAAAALLTSNLKFRGTVSLQIQSSGPLRLLIAQCTDNHELRGIARIGDAPASAGGLQAWLDDPVLSINLEPSGRGRRYQGVVPFSDCSLGASLEYYFHQSEQLDTRVWLAANDHSAAGLMLQKMPDRTVTTEDWQRVNLLAGTVKPEELSMLSTEDLIGRLFNEEDVRLFKPSPARFRCSCSRERVAGVLQSLGRAEVEAALATADPVDVRCEYCNRSYCFDALDVAQLFSQRQVPPPGSVSRQ